MTTEQTDRKLQETLLLARRLEDDRLLLDDAVIVAALEGSGSLTEGERAALLASPLTLRRFRTLAQQRRRIDRHGRHERQDWQDWQDWQGSQGMLRAASGTAALTAKTTDDGYWTLHFVEQDGAWRVILALDAAAPFAARLVREQAQLRVLDGAGSSILEGCLDSDGECENGWPFASAPGPHFQQAGAAFAVQAAP